MARLKVGVLLGREPDEISEWLADAAAFDAAGADALWIDTDPESDILALAAGLAVVTFQARLVVALPDPAGRDRTIRTVRRLSHDRLALTAEDFPDDERWETTPVPQGRAAWRAACADAEERGVAGLVVPADSRMLDILRNPDDPGDRRDLQLAQG